MIYQAALLKNLMVKVDLCHKQNEKKVKQFHVFPIVNKKK